MSIASNAIRAVAAAYNAVHCDVWRIESGALAGTEFFGDAQTEQPMALDSELTADAREKTMLYIDRPIPNLTPNMRIFGLGAEWRIVGERDDNPANDRVRFEIVKTVSGKDK